MTNGRRDDSDFPQERGRESLKTLGTLLDENKSLLTGISFFAAFTFFLTNQSQSLHETLSQISRDEAHRIAFLRLGSGLVNLLSFFVLAINLLLLWELIETLQVNKKRTLRAHSFEICLITISILVCLYWLLSFFDIWYAFISSALVIAILTIIIIGLIFGRQKFHVVKKILNLGRRLTKSRDS